jgi:hypothetical protein
MNTLEINQQVTDAQYCSRRLEQTTRVDQHRNRGTSRSATSVSSRMACTGLALIAFLVCITEVRADEVDKALATIRAAGPGGSGSRPARQARDRIARQGIQVLPRLLQAMDSDNIVALNWYRSAYEQIVAAEWKRKTPRFPVDWLKTFVSRRQHQGRVRRLVLNLVDRLEPGSRTQLISTLLDDPEFRQEAIAIALQRADKAFSNQDLTTAREEYQRIFRHARDSQQILRAADKLKSVGVQVNVIRHMGFVTHWYLLGPFDAPGKTGFELKFPPETKVDLQATYDGQAKQRIGWKRATTTDRLGQINLIQAIAATREAVGYAYAELNSPKQQDAQLRCGADDNLSVWLNDKAVFSRKQWLNGTRLDRFSAPVRLLKGRNRLLVKICQGPQHKNPAVPNNWSLQLRFCDASGAAVGLSSLLPDPSDLRTTNP